LETKRHIEILRHVRLGPELFVTILVEVRDLLNGSPAENGVVTDEGSDITVGDGVTNGSVDEVGEEGDTVLKVGVDDLHDTGAKLHNTDFGALLHLGGSVEKTVGRNTSVGVNEKDVVTDTDVTISPGATVLLEDFAEAALVSLSLVCLSPLVATVDLEKLLLDVAGYHETEVHVGSLLELSATNEAIETVLGTGSPTNAVVGVELNSGLTLLLIEKLKTIVVDEDVGGTTLKLVGGDSLLDRLDGRGNDGCETLLVDRALNGDVRKVATLDAAGEQSRVEARVHGHLANGTDHLSDTTDDDLGEEEGEEDLDGREDDEGDTSVATIDLDLDGQLSVTGSEKSDNDDEGDGDEDGVHEMCWAVLGKNLATLCVDLLLDHTRALLGQRLVGDLFRLTGLPDKLHELAFDQLGTGDEVVGIVIPDDKKCLGGNEGSELMLAGSGEIFHGGKNLNSETVHERHIDGVGRPGKESLDDARVDSHGALNND
jgi:hypothetical protein